MNNEISSVQSEEDLEDMEDEELVSNQPYQSKTIINRPPSISVKSSTLNNVLSVQSDNSSAEELLTSRIRARLIISEIIEKKLSMNG